MNNKFITICFILFAFFTVSVFAYSLQATEKKDEIYPNFLLHNSTSACMQGVVLLIIQYNPTLKNQFIPPAVQQQLLGHCSCVIDRIRVEFTVQEYMKEINDYLWIKNVWGRYGKQCMKAGYLAGLVAQPTDNETKEDTKVEDNKTESLEPKSKVEEIQNEEQTIFQG
jgi:hypothetical protein